MPDTSLYLQLLLAVRESAARAVAAVAVSPVLADLRAVRWVNVGQRTQIGLCHNTRQ